MTHLLSKSVQRISNPGGTPVRSAKPVRCDADVVARVNGVPFGIDFS